MRQTRGLLDWDNLSNADRSRPSKWCRRVSALTLDDRYVVAVRSSAVSSCGRLMTGELAASYGVVTGAASADLPLVVLLGEEGAREADHGVAVGKDP